MKPFQEVTYSNVMEVGSMVLVGNRYHKFIGEIVKETKSRFSVKTMGGVESYDISTLIRRGDARALSPYHITLLNRDDHYNIWLVELRRAIDSQAGGSIYNVIEALDDDQLLELLNTLKLRKAMHNQR